MTHTQLKNAVMLFANQFGDGPSYDAIFALRGNLPEIVRRIVYDIFLNDFNPNDCPAEFTQAYHLLLAYAKQMNLHGYVKFEPEN